ncbi:MAG: polymer-forming cytoskeletal protein [Chitinophagales bacterium]|nr:polymer-forming cytoskeletal protein [Chitinophagales bacterium]
MFNSGKENKESKANSNGLKVRNTFASGTVIHGEIKSEGDIRIDGKVHGTLISKAKVVIGASGVVEGDVFCQNASIEGEVNGKIEVAELLDLKKSAKIDGDIITKKIVVEEGASFNGTCNMGAKKPVFNGQQKAQQAKPELKQSLKKEAI